MSKVLHGVVLEKVDRDHLFAQLRDLGVVGDGDRHTPASTLVERMNQYFVHNKPLEVAVCDKCGGSSDFGMVSCPYCGSMDAESAPTAAPPLVFNNHFTPFGAAVASNGVAKHEAAAEVPATTEPDAPHEDMALDVDLDDAPAPEQEPAMVSGKANGQAAKGTAAAALVAVAAGQPLATKATESELDAAVARVVAAKSAAAVSVWQVGVEIKALHDKQLYKLRATVDGKPKYKTFDAFVTAELGLSSQNAYRLMDVSANFNEAQVRKFGSQKLSLILGAPEEDRQTLLDEKLSKGATYRETEAEVKRLRAAKGVIKRDTGRKKMPLGTPKKAARKDMITVASLEGRRTVKLYAKGSETKLAKRLADMPWGRMELENDVVMFFTVREGAAGDLQLVVKTARAD